MKTLDMCRQMRERAYEIMATDKASANALLMGADKLERAYIDMKYGNVGCDVCAKAMPDGWCDVCDFEWRGDVR